VSPAPRPPDFDELLAAYALDALDAGEARLVEEYLAEHPDARAELDAHRETAAALALTTAGEEAPPPSLWDRIEVAVSGPAGAHDGRVVALRPRRVVGARLAGAVAAAAAVLVVLLAVQVVDLRGRLDDAEDPGPGGFAAAYDRALATPGAQPLALSGDAGPLARVVYLPDGTGYLVNDALAPLPDDRTYQLWALMGSPAAPEVISAGVLGADPRGAAFTVSGDVVGFALTEEVGGGVVRPASEPVALATFPA
jgi:anti-sigma-K factor RskA